MSKKHVLMTILLVIVLALSGCKGGEGDVVSKQTPFVGGTTGVVLTFEQDMPPVEVFDAGAYPFDVAVRVQNVGEADIVPEDMTVRVSGIRAEEFGKSEMELMLNPESDLTRTFKDSEGNVIEGATELVIFEDLNYQKSLVGNQVFPIRADVCYKYQTKATSKICVLSDILDTREEKVCKVNELKEVYNSGAPVLVDNFRETQRGSDELGFSFRIAHRSNGKIYKLGSPCVFNTKEIDRVFVTIDTGIPGLKCSGLKDGTDTSGYIRLTNGERTITCTQNVETNTDFEQIVDITLDYNYEDDIETQVLVKHGED